MPVTSIRDPGAIQDLATYAKLYVPPEQFRVEGASFFDALFPGFMQENSIASTIGFFFQRDDPSPYIPGYDVLETEDESKHYNPESNPMKHIRGFEQFMSRFIRSRSPQDTQRIKDQILREQENNRTLASAGGFGILARIVGGVFDPINFIPFGAAVKTAKGGISLARTSAKFGAIGAVAVGGSEVILHSTQETRTAEESIFAISGGALFSAIIGPAAIGIKQSVFDKAVRILDDEALRLNALEKSGGGGPGVPHDTIGPQSIDVPPGKLNSLSTHDEFLDAVQGGVEVKNAPMLRRLGLKWFPRTSLFLSRSEEAKKAGAALVISSIVLKKGAVVNPIEAQNKIWQARANNITQDLDDFYMRYITGDPNARAGMKHKLLGFPKGGDPDVFGHKLSFDEFSETTGRAMELPNPHDIGIDEAANAAIKIREQLIQPIAKDLVDLGLLGKEVLDNPAYLHRIWNRAKLRDPNEKEALLEVLLKNERDKFGIVSDEARLNNVKALEDAKDSLRKAKRQLGRAKTDATKERLGAKVKAIDDDLARLLEESAKLEKKVFGEVGRRQSLKETIEKIMLMPYGRSMPGDIGWRAPFHTRKIDIENSKIFNWIETDARSIIRHYTRSAASDLEIARRTGLIRAKDDFTVVRREYIDSVFDDEISPAAARRILKVSDEKIVRRFGNPNPKDKRGSLTGEMAKSRKGLYEKIIATGSPDEGLKILAQRDADLMKDFSKGSAPLLIERIEGDYLKKIRAAKTDTEARGLNRELKADLDMVRFITDDIRGLHSIAEDPGSMPSTLMRIGRGVAYPITGGMIVLSAVMDGGILALNHRISSVFRHAIIPMIRGLDNVKITKDEAKKIFGPSEIVSNSVNASRFGLEEGLDPTHVGRLEKGVRRFSTAFSLFNLSAPWNAGFSNVIALTTVGEIMEASERVVRGMAFPRGWKARLKDAGLTDEILVGFNKQFKKHGSGDVFGSTGIAARSDLWDGPSGPELRSLFQSAVLRSREISLIRGGRLDRPAITGNLLGTSVSNNVLMQTMLMYKNFGLKAHSSIFARGLQFRDTMVINGMMAMIGIGILSNWLRTKVTNSKPPDDAFGWVADAFARSGASGMVFDLDQYLMAATDNQFGVSAMLGIKRNRFYSPSDTFGAILGPVGGKAADAIKFGSGLTDLEINEVDVRRLRRLLPLNNLFYLSKIFDELDGSR